MPTDPGATTANRAWQAGPDSEHAQLWKVATTVHPFHPDGYQREMTLQEQAAMKAYVDGSLLVPSPPGFMRATHTKRMRAACEDWHMRERELWLYARMAPNMFMARDGGKFSIFNQFLRATKKGSTERAAVDALIRVTKRARVDTEAHIIAISIPQGYGGEKWIGAQFALQGGHVTFAAAPPGTPPQHIPTIADKSMALYYSVKIGGWTEATQCQLLDFFEHLLPGQVLDVDVTERLQLKDQEGVQGLVTFATYACPRALDGITHIQIDGHILKLHHHQLFARKPCGQCYSAVHSSAQCANTSKLEHRRKHLLQYVTKNASPDTFQATQLLHPDTIVVPRAPQYVCQARPEHHAPITVTVLPTGAYGVTMEAAPPTAGEAAAHGAQDAAGDEADDEKSDSGDSATIPALPPRPATAAPAGSPRPAAKDAKVGATQAVKASKTDGKSTSTNVGKSSTKQQEQHVATPTASKVKAPAKSSEPKGTGSQGEKASLKIASSNNPNTQKRGSKTGKRSQHSEASQRKEAAKHLQALAASELDANVLASTAQAEVEHGTQNAISTGANSPDEVAERAAVPEATLASSIAAAAHAAIEESEQAQQDSPQRQSEAEDHPASGETYMEIEEDYVTDTTQSSGGSAVAALVTAAKALSSGPQIEGSGMQAAAAVHPATQPQPAAAQGAVTSLRDKLERASRRQRGQLEQPKSSRPRRDTDCVKVGTTPVAKQLRTKGRPTTRCKLALRCDSSDSDDDEADRASRDLMGSATKQAFATAAAQRHDEPAPVVDMTLASSTDDEAGTSQRPRKKTPAARSIQMAITAYAQGRQVMAVFEDDDPSPDQIEDARTAIASILAQIKSDYTRKTRQAHGKRYVPNPQRMPTWKGNWELIEVDVPRNGGCLFYAWYATHARCVRGNLSACQLNNKEATFFMREDYGVLLHHMDDLIRQQVIHLPSLFRRYFPEQQVPNSLQDTRRAIRRYWSKRRKSTATNIRKISDWAGAEEIFGLCLYSGEPVFVLSELDDGSTAVQLYRPTIHEGNATVLIDVLTNEHITHIINEMMHYVIIPTIVVHRGGTTGHYTALRFPAETYPRWHDNALSGTIAQRRELVFEELGMPLLPAHQVTKVYNIDTEEDSDYLPTDSASQDSTMSNEAAQAGCSANHQGNGTDDSDFEPRVTATSSHHTPSRADDEFEQAQRASDTSSSAPGEGRSGREATCETTTARPLQNDEVVIRWSTADPAIHAWFNEAHTILPYEQQEQVALAACHMLTELPNLAQWMTTEPTRVCELGQAVLMAGRVYELTQYARHQNPDISGIAQHWLHEIRSMAALDHRWKVAETAPCWRQLLIANGTAPHGRRLTKSYDHFWFAHAVVYVAMHARHRPITSAEDLAALALRCWAHSHRYEHPPAGTNDTPWHITLECVDEASNTIHPPVGPRPASRC